MDESDCATTIFYMFYASACLIDKAGIIFCFRVVRPSQSCPRVHFVTRSNPTQPTTSGKNLDPTRPNPIQLTMGITV